MEADRISEDDLTFQLVNILKANLTLENSVTKGTVLCCKKLFATYL